MLTRLEVNPHAVFTERELTLRDPDEFERLKQLGLITSEIHRLPSYIDRDGRLLLIDKQDGRFEAFDEEDPDFEPFELAPSDIRRWRVDLDRLTDLLRKENGLYGPSGPLHERLLLIGQPDRHRAVVLALLHGTTQGLPLVRSIATLVSGRTAQVLVVTPTFELAANHHKTLEALDISVKQMSKLNPLMLPPWPDPAEPPAAPAREPKSAWPAFPHSPDYRWIKLGEDTYEPTSRQAQVIELLDTASKIRPSYAGTTSKWTL